MRRNYKLFLIFMASFTALGLLGLAQNHEVLAAVTKNWVVNGQHSIFNAGLGPYDVGVTQGLLGGAATMELTTMDKSGNQAVRMILRGNSDSPNTEFYSGTRGAETLKMAIRGIDGAILWGSGGNARLSDAHGGSIELGGKGTPYIDFNNDLTSDYDMRMILTGNDSLNIDGGNVGVGVSSPVAKFEVNGDISTRNAGTISAGNNNLAGMNFGWLGDQAQVRLGGDGPGAWNGLAIRQVGNATLLKIDETSGTVKLTSDYPTICIGKC